MSFTSRFFDASSHTKRTSRIRRRWQSVRPWLAVESVEDRTLLSAPALISTSPANGSHRAPASTDVVATFDQSVTPVSVTDQTFVVHAMQSHRLLSANGAISSLTTNADTVTLDPASDFRAGELVQLTTTSEIENSASESATPRVWQFRANVAGGSGVFADTGQALGGSNTRATSLGDLDDDGDLDAFVANVDEPNRVWLNDGNGAFTDSGQLIDPMSATTDVALGDLDGDGDLDAFVVNFRSQADQIWLNDGVGSFVDSGQALTRPGTDSRKVSLGDLDGDGDLDAFSGNNGPNLVWLNDGNGTFTDSGQLLGNLRTLDVVFGDYDSDGDLDVFIVSDFHVHEIWLNDGSGLFTNTGQMLSLSNGRTASAGDVDGDGDLDVLAVNDFQQHRMWLNDGTGTFSDSGQVFGDGNLTQGVELGDLDGDGDLDAFDTGVHGRSNRIWLNDGTGFFTNSGQALGNSYSEGVSLGDLDGDGDLDAFISNERSQANRVWLNVGTPAVPVTVTVDLANVSVPEADTAINSGTFEGAGVSLTTSVGTISDIGNGTWNWSFDTTDGPANSQTVTVTATGRNGDFRTATFDLIVTNLAPTITNLISNATLQHKSTNGNVQLEGAFADAGAADTHTVVVDWGDGSSLETISVDQLAGTFGGSHTYAAAGIFEITLKVTDDDGGFVTDTTSAVVQGVGVIDGVLYIIGTDGDDYVKLQVSQKKDRLKVNVNLNQGGGDQVKLALVASEISRVVAFLCGGDDHYDGGFGGARHGGGAPGINVRQMVFGGAGDDRLRGGRWSDAIFGGTGDDRIRGQGGNDILAGGDGKDAIRGGQGDDLLIGGILDNEFHSLSILDDVDSAMAEWAGGNLTATLTALGPAIDDSDKDKLFGGKDDDALFGGLGDILSQ